MKKFLAALALAVLPVAANAGDMSYTYVDLEYAYTSQFTYSEDSAPLVTKPIFKGDGIIVGGSFGFMDNFHVSAELGMHSGEFNAYDSTIPATPVYFTVPDVEHNTTWVAVGYHTSVGDNVDGYVNLGYMMNEIDFGAGGSVDEKGLGVEMGFRAAADALEVGMSVRYADIPSPFSDRYSTKLQLGYNFTDMIGVFLGYRTGNDQAGTAGVRVSF